MLATRITELEHRLKVLEISGLWSATEQEPDEWAQHTSTGDGDNVHHTSTGVMRVMYNTQLQVMGGNVHHTPTGVMRVMYNTQLQVME